jgi:hypothetical protein
MKNATNPVVIETSRGPSIHGTRLTIYHLMDLLKYGRSPDYVQGWYQFTDEEWAAIQEYMREHEAELEVRYAEVLRRAEEDRKYWMERNKHIYERLNRPREEYEIVKLRAKLAAEKAEHEQCKSS